MITKRLRRAVLSEVSGGRLPRLVRLPARSTDAQRHGGPRRHEYLRYQQQSGALFLLWIRYPDDRERASAAAVKAFASHLRLRTVEDLVLREEAPRARPTRSEAHCPHRSIWDFPRDLPPPHLPHDESTAARLPAAPSVQPSRTGCRRDLDRQARVQGAPSLVVGALSAAEAASRARPSGLLTARPPRDLPPAPRRPHAPPRPRHRPRDLVIVHGDQLVELVLEIRGGSSSRMSSRGAAAKIPCACSAMSASSSTSAASSIVDLLLGISADRVGLRGETGLAVRPLLPFTYRRRHHTPRENRSKYDHVKATWLTCCRP